MAIAIQPKFPIPDRSSQAVRFAKDEDGVVDIAWCDGVLSDGRAFRAEMWAQDQISMLTIFFSTAGLEDLDPEAMKRFVEEEGLVSFRKTAASRCTAVRVIDDAGSPVWSVNVVVGDQDETYLDGSVPIFPYSESGEPNTVFYSVPIEPAGNPIAGI